jgi:hypothetical protein
MRAEPWLDETRHGINHAISFGCDYCATDRRRRDVVWWRILLQKPVETGIEDVVSKVRDHRHAAARFGVMLQRDTGLGA